MASVKLENSRNCQVGKMLWTTGSHIRMPKIRVYLSKMQSVRGKKANTDMQSTDMQSTIIRRVTQYVRTAEHLQSDRLDSLVRRRESAPPHRLPARQSDACAAAAAAPQVCWRSRRSDSAARRAAE